VFLVDTNVFVYAVNRLSPENKRCRHLVDGWRHKRDAWFTTWPILYEFLRVSTHPRVFPEPLSVGDAWSFVESLLGCPGMKVITETDRHGDVAAACLAEMPNVRAGFFHDAHTAILMREHGISKIVTRDAGFRRFPFLEIIDPLTEPLTLRERAAAYGGGRGRSPAGRLRAGASRAGRRGSAGRGTTSRRSRPG
jgi:toxin-antitoxin system PIN domain toxin